MVKKEARLPLTKKEKVTYRSSIIDDIKTDSKVKIKLAGSRAEYSINKALICQHSAFFSAAFKNGMRESQDGCVELSGVCQDAFETFIFWLYERKVRLPDGSENVTKENFEPFIDLYVLADIYDTLELRNDIVKIFWEFCKEELGEFTREQYGQMLRALPSTSKLYAGLLADSIGSLDPSEYEECKEICTTFPLDAVIALFHAHASGQLKEWMHCSLEEYLEVENT